MAGTLAVALKEGTSAAATVKEGAAEVLEKAKELDPGIEKVKETVGDAFKEIAQKADTETAKNTSLSSLIESVKEQNDGKENANDETNETNENNEGKEGHEGLTDEQKEKLRELTGWSDEIIDANPIIQRYIVGLLRKRKRPPCRNTLRQDGLLAQNEESR